MRARARDGDGAPWHGLYTPTGYAARVTSRTCDRPGLTACALCAGETLGDDDALPGGQRARLERLGERGVARLTFVDCLDECERGDVVVARPTAAQRAAGARPVWFERLAGDQSTGTLGRWLEDGGPGAAAVPVALADHVLARGSGGEGDLGQAQVVDRVEQDAVEGDGGVAVHVVPGTSDDVHTHAGHGAAVATLVDP